MIVVRVKQIVDALIAYVQRDYESVPETQTLLYQRYWGVREGSFDFYEQAKKLFLRTAASPRRLRTSLEYPKDKVGMPCVVIREPNRSPMQNKPFGGVGDPEMRFGVETYQREGFVSYTSSSVNIMCFTDNPLETMLICDVLYSLLQGAHSTIAEQFMNFSFSTSELIAENHLFPTPIIIKTISLDLDLEEYYPSIQVDTLLHCFKFEPPIPIREGGGGYENEPVERFFQFTSPYVWLDSMVSQGEVGVLSNTDWFLTASEQDAVINYPEGYLDR